MNAPAKADSVRETHTEPSRRDRQPRGRYASHRPADEHQAVRVVNPLPGEMHRAQQVGAAAVVGV